MNHIKTPPPAWIARRDELSRLGLPPQEETAKIISDFRCPLIPDGKMIAADGGEWKSPLSATAEMVSGHCERLAQSLPDRKGADLYQKGALTGITMGLATDLIVVADSISKIAYHRLICAANPKHSSYKVRFSQDSEWQCYMEFCHKRAVLLEICCSNISIAAQTPEMAFDALVSMRRHFAGFVDFAATLHFAEIALAGGMVVHPEGQYAIRLKQWIGRLITTAQNQVADYISDIAAKAINAKRADKLRLDDKLFGAVVAACRERGIDLEERGTPLKFWKAAARSAIVADGYRFGVTNNRMTITDRNGNAGAYQFDSFRSNIFSLAKNTPTR